MFKFLLLGILMLSTSMARAGSADSCFRDDPELFAKIVDAIPKSDAYRITGFREFGSLARDSKFWNLGSATFNRLGGQTLEPLSAVNASGWRSCATPIEFTVERAGRETKIECFAGLVVTKERKSYFNVKECGRFAQDAAGEREIVAVLNALQSKVQ